MFNHLVNAYSKGQRTSVSLRKCIFVWSVHDRAMIDATEKDRYHKLLPSGELPLSFQPDLVGRNWTGEEAKDVSAGGPVSANVVSQLDSSNVALMDQPVQAGGARIDVVEAERKVSFSFDEDLSSKDPFHAEFYITSIRGKEEFAQANIDHVRQPFLRFGRPDIAATIERVSQLCAKEGIARVGVVACGPLGLLHDVTSSCRRSHNGVRFDLHLEEFNL
jgi:hypothetical protein